MKKALLVLFAMLWFFCGFAQMPSQKNGKWGIERGSGNVIIPFEYDEIESKHMKGVYDLRKNGKWGIALIAYDLFVDKKVNVFIIPCEYDEKFDYYSIIMPAKKEGKWGIIDDENKTIISFEYDEKFKFAKTMQIKKGGKWGVIDDKNEVIIPFEYEGIELNKSNKEVLFAKKNGKWGLINKKNQAVTKFFAEEMSGVFETLVSFKIPSDTKDPALKQLAGWYGAMTTKGKLLVPPCRPADDSDKAQLLFNLVFASELKQYENIDCNQLDIEKEWEKRISSEKEAEKEAFIKGMKAIQKAIQE